MERFKRNLGFYASSVSSVDQVALARLLESGDYERHVNRVRVRAREARDGRRRCLCCPSCWWWNS